jgi:hypothetical protein
MAFMALVMPCMASNPSPTIGGRTVPPSRSLEAVAASARHHHNLLEANPTDPVSAAACSRHAWEAVRPVVPWEVVVHWHCASEAWAVGRPSLHPPRVNCSQSGDSH